MRVDADEEARTDPGDLPESRSFLDLGPVDCSVSRTWVRTQSSVPFPFRSAPFIQVSPLSLVPNCRPRLFGCERDVESAYVYHAMVKGFTGSL